MALTDMMAFRKVDTLITSQHWNIEEARLRRGEKVMIPLLAVVGNLTMAMDQTFVVDEKPSHK
jgi:hypothetical protein